MRRSSRGSFTTSRCWVAMIVDRRRALRVGVLPLRLEAPPRRRRRIDGVLQRLVGEPPPRLLMPVLVVRFVDGGEQRVGQPVVEARRGRLSRQLAERRKARRSLRRTRSSRMSNSVPRPVPNSSATMMTATIGTHGRRALWAKSVPEPFPFRRVWNQPREKGLEGRDLAAARRVRRRPVAVVDDQAVFRERRPRLVGTGLDRIDLRPQRMRHPDIDDGRLLEPAPRAFFHDRVGLHEAAQAGDRSLSSPSTSEMMPPLPMKAPV